MTLHSPAVTYCNPLPLPDYPRGRSSIKPAASGFGWVAAQPHDFRETADPSVLYVDGQWYLYPSAGMAYVSADGCAWRHHRIEPYDCGYAPTVVRFRNRFLLTACHAPLLAADHPLGPFQPIGPMLDCDGNPIADWSDPMLFADDDGQLYAYWGLGGDGIKGARLDPAQPNRCLTPRQVLFTYNPAHVWERFGEWNEDINQSYVEGPWMVKVRGRYYLTYAAPGTEFRTYAMGAYVGASPLGPFVPQPRNPICTHRDGLIRGPGHGCIVAGPNDTLWAFYTCTVGIHHLFERRIGMDPAGIDAEGNLFVRAGSEIPQIAPGQIARPELGNDSGLLPVNRGKFARASSNAPGRTPDYAVDGYMRSWWQPAADDPQPQITALFRGAFDVSSLRLIWTEPGLNYAAGCVPGPIRYRLETAVTNGPWRTVLDRSASGEDLLIDYRAFPTVRADQARLTILEAPRGLNVGLIDFTVFGVSART